MLMVCLDAIEYTYTVQYWVWPGDLKMELQDINNVYYKSSRIQHPWVGCSVWPATVCAMAAWVDILVRAWQWLLAPRVLGTAVVPMVVTRRCVALMSTGQGCCRGNTPHPLHRHNHVTVVLQPKKCFKTMLFFTVMCGGGGQWQSCPSTKHRSCPLVPAKGMSRSAGHCFLTNVKLQGLEDRWLRGLTKITY